MTYFEQRLPLALVFGSFFAIFLPLALLQLAESSLAWLPYVLMIQAVGLGSSHFFVTLAVYLQSANMEHFASSSRNRVVYFALPAAILLFFAFTEAVRLRETRPLLAAYLFGAVRFLDFFHVGRQSVGMLQLFKRQLPQALPAWSRSAENAFFVGMAALQWQTFLLGGRFASDELVAVVPAVVLLGLCAMLLFEHVKRAAQASGHPGRFVPLTYFGMQAVCAATAAYDTRLYLVSLTLHYVEYHVIMMPRLFHTPLSRERALDRLSARLRSHALLFYGALAAVVVLFELRIQVAKDVAPATAFFVHLFDGIFVVHYFVEAFLWKFGNPHYRKTLAPLYFGAWPPTARADSPAVVSTQLPETSPSAELPPVSAAAARAVGGQAPAGLAGGRMLALCAAFFASGASALVFETLWFHQAGLGFGNGVWASSVVLAGFMAGMGLGNWLAARRGDRLRSGLAAYAVLELVIAVSGVALVYLLPVCGHLLAAPARALAGTPAWLEVLRFVLAFALLLVPSTAMGMTLPLLVRAARGFHPSFGRVLGLLYGVNTAGAVLGVLGTELVLLPALGIRATGWFAGALNLAAAGVAWALARRARSLSPFVVAPELAAPSAPRARQLPWLLAAFGAGFALLALEVVWLRFAMLFLNDTPLAFALILAAVLAGIALGGLACSAWASASRSLARFAPLVAAATGLCALLGYLLYAPVLERYYALDQGAAAVLIVIAPLVLPASFASGVLFAVLGEGLRDVADGDASAAGRLAFANTLGAGIGSLVAGFVLLPYAGMERSFFALFALYGVIAALLALPRHELPPLLRYAGLAALALGLAFFPFGKVSEKFIRASAGRWMSAGDEIAGVREGLTGTLVHVVHGQNGLPLFDQLATNAYSMTVNDFAGRRYMELFVLLPRAVHPGLKRALVVGYGIGNTAAALGADAELERIDIVDISRDILAISRQMRTAGPKPPLEDPRVRVHIEDGRYFLQTTHQRFDLITGEPPPPIMAGVANLYTREYFELVRARLSSGGVATHWLPIMNISAATTKSLIRAFCDAFEDCSLWHGSARNFMLMGTRGAGAAGPVDAQRFARVWNDAAARAELQAIGVELPGQLGALFIGDAGYLDALTQDALPLTDDQPKRMHQPGTRQERDALTWQWRDTAAAQKRFEQSALIARLFPEPIRRETLRQFENQRLLDDLLFPGQTAARQTVVLHQVLHGTSLRLPVLLLLGSDPDIQRSLRSAEVSQRERPEWLLHRAVGAIAERDFVTALGLLEDVPDGSLPLPDLRQYLRYAVERAASAGKR